jgi:NADPH:quinone reductase-like Zn-dependent oxidoreductase
MSTIREFRLHRFGGPEVLRLDEVEPSLPDASQVLVAIKAASVNPVDFKIRSGKYPAVKGDRLPYTLGRDVSGVVEKCGAQATAFKVGDEVFGIVGIGGGGYAEKTVLDQKAIARKPASLDHAHAAAIPLAGQTAWQGLFRYGQLMPGQSILIHGGSGGVGHFAVQLAKAKGARVLTTAGIERIVERAARLGLQFAIEINQQIPTGNEIKPGERRILQKAMTRKKDNVAKLAANAIVIALAGEEAAQPLVIQAAKEQKNKSIGARWPRGSLNGLAEIWWSAIRSS